MQLHYILKICTKYGIISTTSVSYTHLDVYKRQIYGGAVGYIDLTGNLDTCIAIRLAYKKHSKVYVRSGAGIVADSVAVKEHNECINKAKAVMTALNASGEEE